MGSQFRWICEVTGSNEVKPPKTAHTREGHNGIDGVRWHQRGTQRIVGIRWPSEGATGGEKKFHATPLHRILCATPLHRRIEFFFSNGNQQMGKIYCNQWWCLNYKVTEVNMWARLRPGAFCNLNPQCRMILISSQKEIIKWHLSQLLSRK